MILSLVKRLQKELVILLACILICGMFLVTAHGWRQASYKNKNIQSLNLKQIKNKYHTAVNQKALLDKFEKSYINLNSAGIVGEEKRLNWVVSLEKIIKENKIPYIKYKINERQLFTSESLSQSYPGITLYKSKMILDMQLLHEGDMYTLFNAFAKQAKGLFDIQNCSIKRKPVRNESLAKSISGKNLTATCVLNWYTLTKQTNSDLSSEGI